MHKDRYAVTGYPVSHSQSPMIHGHFASQTGEAVDYQKLPLHPDEFESGVKQFFSHGGKGLNVTVPHKESAWQMAAIHAPAAERAGAVNTLYLNQEGELVGDNTDGVGMVRDIEHNHGGNLKGANLLVLGAGGAVRGVLPVLIAAQPASIVIANRTLARAEALAELFADLFPITVLSYQQLDSAFSRAPEWIINGTAAGLSGEMPELPDTLVDQHTACYDMVYAPGGTVFQRWAESLGANKSLDGTGMLVEQAAESFRIWRGKMPDTKPVIAELQKALFQSSAK